jgi:hypothetical protein
VYVTTSWDDGHEFDPKLAAELAPHWVAGSLYVAPCGQEIPENKRLTPTRLKWTPSPGQPVGLLK